MHQQITIQCAGRRVLPSQTGRGNFWQLTMGATVVGWATSYEAAEAKRRRYELARRGGAV
ncbi:hypothetical protein ACS8E9_09505 [Pseudomonas neustonica]|uniref:hypothetical protein n=1 Tax=Pseudomonas neustonica TaxID=2487346 RepID=UPI003F46AC92